MSLHATESAITISASALTGDSVEDTPILYMSDSSLELNNTTLSSGGGSGVRSYGPGDIVLNQVTMDGLLGDSLHLFSSTSSTSSLEATDLTISNGGNTGLNMFGDPWSVNLTNTVIEGCTSTYTGGVNLGPDITLTASGLTLRNHQGEYTGGIDVGTNSSVTLTDSTIEGNTATGSYRGGGVALTDTGASASFSNVDFSGNPAAGSPSDVSLVFSPTAGLILGTGFTGTCTYDGACTAQ